MNILVTGADGFIGKNLCVKLVELGYESITKFDRNNSLADLMDALKTTDFIFHLAGINRPLNDEEFKSGNVGLTEYITNTLLELERSVPLLLTSSIQADKDNAYGISKAAAEDNIYCYQQKSKAATYIYRLPNVFGKWCKPNYNSMVATFCYNTLHDLPITINDSKSKVNLVYIDDVCEQICRHLTENNIEPIVEPIYQQTVGTVAELLAEFKQSRETLVTADVGTGFIRALYSTYISYFDSEYFGYTVPAYTDPRGTFCEMLKTPNAGQFSYFTAHPGITRGGHYHHTKNEKFLVIKGTANFRFQNILTNEKSELVVDANEHRIVETVPGWTHDVTNIGSDELIVMLWANEIFDREKPDTFAKPL
ncbi:capsular biosynthesis protein [Photobacterium phosphoreum]|uniref:UDP-2-acetamido-2,6-beta-L-arabino-hexul-4-ose reductase n=1 Tax=Photobacterium phosphoreum TaxID=659 RepID=UPI000D15DF8E|nr:NAD-dependent epimerase/dehydratase family protein [Photobacterium phosphoreum]PSU64865.1 capsular biosynthesis protein [Photobacterium phosphoreum]PSW06409.1 capsular biosynthesis protein [Photobacterium phosphoreum]